MEASFEKNGSSRPGRTPKILPSRLGLTKVIGLYESYLESITKQGNQRMDFK